MNRSTFQRAASIISEAEALIITAGAGMGVDSGLPDFRGNQGFWKAYPPYTSKGLSFVDMANPHWFRSDPAFAWGFYGHRQTMYRTTVPHQGFTFLKQWVLTKPKGYFVFTSNVDGQFQKAGFGEENIEEVHGSIHYLQCTDNCGRGIFSADGMSVDIDESSMTAVQPLPLCPSCGALARPNVLMFGDWEYDGQRQIDQVNRFRAWLDTIGNSRLVVIECGAGKAVPTVRMTSERLVSQLNGTLIRINVREAEVPKGHISFDRPALETLAAIHRELPG